MKYSFNPCFNGINIQTSCILSRYISTKSCFNPCFNGINIQTPYALLLVPIVSEVSILVLMESTFRHIPPTPPLPPKAGFNPCFNGINIQTLNHLLTLTHPQCFNPCFNGINIQTIRDLGWVL